MRTEYMVYGYCGGLPFREYFSTEGQASDYADRFRRWHSGDDYCKVARCEITDIG